MDDARDRALVIGAGAGGLFTALLLARLGHRVTVVERNRQPGGLMRGYVREGIECPVGVHYLGAMGEGQPLRRIFDFLGLSGAIPLQPMDPVVDRYLFEEQQPFDLPVGLDRFEANLRAAFPAEGTQLDAVMDGLRQADARMQALDFVFDEGRDAAVFKELRPVGELLDRVGCSAGMRRVLGMTCGWMGVPLAECPQALHHVILCSYLASSWRLRESGTQMARAFCERLEALGGELRCGEAVTRVLVQERVARGIELASGERLEAPLVIGAVHPKVMLPLLPRAATKPAYRNRISGLEETRGVFCVQAAVPAEAAPAQPHNTMRWVEQGPTGAGEILFYQLSASNRPGLNLLTILRPDDIGRWLDGAGGARRPGYAEAKAAEAERLLASARPIYGPLPGARVIDVYTPVTVRDWVNSPGGSAYGVLRSNRQRFQTALLNRTPVQGLHLCGQSAFAPGIFGTALGALRTVRMIEGREGALRALAPLFEG